MTTTQFYFALGATFGTALTLLIQFLIPKIRKWQQDRRDEAEAKRLAEEERLRKIEDRSRLYGRSFRTLMIEVFGDSARDTRKYYSYVEKDEYSPIGDVSESVVADVIWLAEDTNRIEQAQEGYIRPEGDTCMVRIVIGADAYQNRIMMLFEQVNHKEERTIVTITEYKVGVLETNLVTVEQHLN